LFSGTCKAGLYQKYNYRYYATTGNYPAVETDGNIALPGPSAGNKSKVIGPLESSSPQGQAAAESVSQQVS